MSERIKSDPANETLAVDHADALSGLAQLLRVRPELQSICRFGDNWAAPHARESETWAPFHIVTDGMCMLHLPASGRSIELHTGDVALLPHGSAHITHGITTPGINTPANEMGSFDFRSHDNGAIRIISNAHGDTDVQLICGRLKFEHADPSLILSTLPEIIVVGAGARDDAAQIARLIALVREELLAARPGSAAITANLASALLVTVLRAHIEIERSSSTIVTLLGHSQAGRAVSAMLKTPGRAWTLDELASVARCSRASLVRIFRKSAGVAPLAFLSKIRLELAKLQLMSSDRSLGDIAAEIGYCSESAFSRAFQLRYGMRPGELRRYGAYDFPKAP